MRFFIQNKKESLGIVKGKILYSDLNAPITPLFSKYSQLIGKPDYIIRKEGHYIPVEVKSGEGPFPHKSQILQLATYCQILEDIYRTFIPEGILVYNTIKYRIPFDPKLRFELESQMKIMRTSLRNGVVQRNHKDPARCQHCSMKHYCTNALHKNHFSIK